MGSTSTIQSSSCLLSNSFSSTTPPLKLKLKLNLFFSPNSNPRSNRVVVVRADTGGGGTNKNINKTSTAEQKWVTKGLITESLPNGMFWVRLDNGDVVLGYISGKIRRNSIRMLAGDKVKIEVSRYDSTRGRIVYRIGNKDN